MSTLTITIALILITLAATMVSLFWRGTLRQKLLLLVLAVCSSAGAIYETYEMERRDEAVIRLLIRDSVPDGFEDALLQAANQIAIQEKYSKAILREIASEWNADNFGYVIGFIEPSAERPLTGYEENSIRTGYEHAFVYVSNLVTQELKLTFVKDGDLKEVLEERTLWVWENVDMTDKRFLQSMQGIAYLAYSAATNLRYSHEFQRHPEKFWIDLDINEMKNITVLAIMRDAEEGRKDKGWRKFQLNVMSWSDVEKLVGKDAITRGGIIFYRLFEKLFADWTDSEYLPVVLGR